MYSQKLSVIVPVHKGESYIKESLLDMKQSFGRYFKNLEIIAVIDGMLDRSFEEARKVSGVKVVGYQNNRGKGYALKHGFRYCTGDFVTFIDGDRDINPKVFWNFLPYMTTADMVIGSKRHPFSSLEYPLHRRILSSGYHLFSWLVLGLRLKDTQTGLKLMKRELLEVVLPLTLVKRYAFDVELCFLAHKHGFRIAEAPIEIKYKKNNGSGVNYKAIFGMFVDTIAIRYRYSILRYYQKRYKEIRFGR